MFSPFPFSLKLHCYTSSKVSDYGRLDSLGSLSCQLKADLTIPHVSTAFTAFFYDSVPMSTSTLGSQSFSILGPSTPTIDLTTQKAPLVPSRAGSCWTAPLRDGLPTPPNDMTGVTYNAIPPVAHGVKMPGMPNHFYPHSRPFDSISSSVANAKPNHVPVKDVPATEPVQKKSSATASGSQLRIPLSINNSKGNLAEFAAQVRASSVARGVIVYTKILTWWLHR